MNIAEPRSNGYFSYYNLYTYQAPGKSDYKLAATFYDDNLRFTQKVYAFLRQREHNCAARPKKTVHIYGTCTVTSFDVQSQLREKHWNRDFNVPHLNILSQEEQAKFWF